jgi:hypothetical protein
MPWSVVVKRPRRLGPPHFPFDDKFPINRLPEFAKGFNYQLYSQAYSSNIP